MKGPWIVVLFLSTAAGLQAETRFIFPRVLLQQGRFAGVAVANPTSQTAELTFRAYGLDGNPLGQPLPQPPLKPGEQRAILASQILSGIAIGPAPVRGWMEMTSVTDGLTGFFLDGDDALNYMDGSDLPSAALRQTLPLVESGGGSSTEISIVNPDQVAADVELEFFTPDGAQVALRKRPIPKNGALAGPLTELFPNVDYARVAGIRLRSDRPVVCLSYISRQGDNSLVTQGALNPGLAAKILYFPQLAQGDGWSTTVGIANLSDADALVTITAFKPDGSLYSAPDVKQNPVTRQVRKGGVLRVRCQELFGFPQAPLAQGWMKAETTHPALYGYVEYGAGRDRAFVAAQVENLSRMIFSHQAMQAPFFTGLAILNPSSLVANIEVTYVNKEGKAVAKAQRVLRPNHRESDVLNRYIAQTNNENYGSVVIKSDIPIIATQLFWTQDVLANVPPQRVTTDYDPAAGLPAVRVSPPMAVVETGKRQKFTASGIAGLRWEVGGQAGGRPEMGTITADGTYTAPSRKPDQPTITVGATDGTQSGGASINVVQRETLVTGLGLVSAVAYFENVQRFFIAEQQALSSEPAAAGDLQAVANTNILEQLPTGERRAFLPLAGETVGKMIPFEDAKGGNYLLVAGTDSGQIYRVQIDTKQQVVIARDLKLPSSMALDPQSGNLLVCESDQVTTIPRARFDPSLSAPGTPTAPSALGDRGRRSVQVLSPRGIAVDRCSGAVYVATSSGEIREYQGGRQSQYRVVVSGLTAPSEILPLYVEGMPSCEESLVLLVCAERSVAVVFPAFNLGLLFLSDGDLPRDLEFLPESSPFAGGTESVAIAESNSVSSVGVESLYGEDDPSTSEDEEFAGGDRLPHGDPDSDTFEGETTYQEDLSPHDILAVDALPLSDSVILGITFADLVEPASELSPYSIIGYIDFDTIPNTGIPSVVDEYNDFGDTGLGIDAFVDLGKGTLVNVATGLETPVEMAFLDDVLLIEIPKSVFDVSAARFALIVGNFVEGTDLAPNEGSLDMVSAAFAPSGTLLASGTPPSESSQRLPRPPRRPRASK